MSDINPFPGPSTPTSPSPAAATTTVPASPTKGVSNLPEHRHCEVCGRSIAMGNRVCSPECQKRFDEAVKAKKRGMYMMVGLVGLLLLYSMWQSGQLNLG